MLKIIANARDLDICQLKGVYAESLGYNGAPTHGGFRDNARLLRDEEQFYSYAYTFLKDPNAFYGIWLEDSSYVSAVRVDRFLDGVLISGLETTPKQRGRGFAKALVCAVSEHFAQKGTVKIYSHVSKNNHASLAVHRACGFETFKNSAVFLDGSASSDYITLCRVNK